jgi:hypothetical protein
LSLLSARAASNSVRLTGCYAPAPFHCRISISNPSPPGGIAGKVQQLDHLLAVERGRRVVTKDVGRLEKFLLASPLASSDLIT